MNTPDLPPEAREAAALAIARVYYGATAVDSLSDLTPSQREMYLAQADACAAVLWIPVERFSYGGLQLADASTTKYRDGRHFAVVQFAPEGRSSNSPRAVLTSDSLDLADWVRPGVPYEIHIMARPTPPLPVTP